MAVKKTAGRTKRALAFALLFGPAFILSIIGLINLRSCDHRFTELDDYGVVPEYAFVDGEGVERTSEDFNDQIVVINVLQPTCPENCSLSFWHLDQDIYQRIRKNKKKLGGVRMISFVVDADGNPLEDVSGVRDMLYDRVEGYDPEIWYLASGDYGDLFEFKLNPELLKEVNGYFGEEDHWKLMALIDRNNHYRIAVEGNTEGLIRKMKHYIALLQKEYDKKAANEKK